MIKRYSNNELYELSHILREGGVISVPTDTVYGVCASINSISGYNKLYEVKNREKKKNFPLMCSDIEQIEKITVVNENARKIINKFMPGPITIILKKKSTLASYITNGKDTVAIRLATSNILKELIEKVGCPLFMTSANISGEKPCNNLEEIEKSCPLIDGMLEGDIKYGLPSTIVDCTSSEIKIIREGPVSLTDLEQILKK